MADRFHYGRLMHKALRGLMAEVLSEVAENGLPGEHHFFITFDTTHPGVDIPDHLRARHPEQMTIVLQEWFEDLSVTAERFAVVLSFANKPEPLCIPFDAIRTFVDPSVEFGLRFDTAEVEDALEDDEETPGPTPVALSDEAEEAPDPREERSGDVVSLDKFRKN